MSITPKEAWRLVNALTAAARRHEAELLHGTHEGRGSAVDAECVAERAIVAALTGCSTQRAEFFRPNTLGMTANDTSDLPANLIPIPSDDDREAERQAAFGRACTNRELPDGVDDDSAALAEHVAADVA
jgi:hypothetical protein